MANHIVSNKEVGDTVQARRWWAQTIVFNLQNHYFWRSALVLII